nr:MAG TPA: hypothetical protein [Caudoviricetes sp.]
MLGTLKPLIYKEKSAIAGGRRFFENLILL